MQGVQYLDSLRKGQCALIDELCDDCTCLKLIELGCLPGAQVRVKLSAPNRDPIAIEVDGNLISVRKSEAKTIRVRAVSAF